MRRPRNRDPLAHFVCLPCITAPTHARWDEIYICEARERRLCVADSSLVALPWYYGGGGTAHGNVVILAGANRVSYNRVIDVVFLDSSHYLNRVMVYDRRRGRRGLGAGLRGAPEITVFGCHPVQCDSCCDDPAITVLACEELLHCDPISSLPSWEIGHG